MPNHPTWLAEGSAEFFGLAISTKNSLRNYLQVKKLIEIDVDERESLEDLLAEYLDMKNFDTKSSEWGTFDNSYAYQLGFSVSEVLVALNGPESILELFTQLGDGVKFEEAFKSIYGIDWEKAIPILAKTIAKNLT